MLAPINRVLRMNEEQVTLQALQQYIESHPERAQIEQHARWLRNTRDANGEAFSIAIALVGAEMAAQP